MTGISSPYEAPTNPEIEVKTEKLNVDEATEHIINAIYPKLNHHE
jgi:adenylylsulfate kinase